MATLPDAQSLGERPAIRTSSSVASVGGATGYEGVAARNELSVANDLTNAGDILHKAQNEYDQITAQSAANTLNQKRLDLEFNQQDGFQNVRGANAANPEFYAAQKQRFDDAAAAVSENLTPMQKRMFQPHAQQAGLMYQSSLLQHVARENNANADNVFKGTIDGALQQVQADPTNEAAFQTAIATGQQAIAQQSTRLGLPPESISENTRKFEQNAWVNRVDTIRISSDGGPVAALQMMQENKDKFDPKEMVMLSHRLYMGAAPVLAQQIADKQMQGGTFSAVDPKSTTGIPAFDGMPDDWKLHVINLANAQLGRVNTLADKTAGEMDQQFATGYPADALTKARWDGNLTQAGRHQEFVDYQTQEANLQTLLQSPVDQQLAYKAKIANSLATNGGSVKDVANFTRLSSAIDKNVKMSQDTPIEFMALRQNTSIQPIQASDLTDPAKLGPIIQARFDKLDAAGLPQKPLTAQEAGFFADNLSKVAPTAAANLFGIFRQAAGNDDRYMSLMQQAGNGSMPEAYAGMVWAKQQTIPSGSNLFGTLFSPNPTLNANQISTTMVTGARILNQANGAKSDGKQISLFLPDPNEFQNKYVNLVGDAFAGSPEAAKNGLNMMRTYYAGRASEKGIMAQDKSLGSVNSDILNEALKVTIGDIASIGGANVIAPYGMAHGEFENQAQDKFNAAIAERNVTDPSLWGRVTLSARGNDVYQVVDPTDRSKALLIGGKPMFLDFGQNHMVDQYGRKPSDLIPTDVPINATNAATGKIKR